MQAGGTKRILSLARLLDYCSKLLSSQDVTGYTKLCKTKFVIESTHNILCYSDIYLPRSMNFIRLILRKYKRCKIMLRCYVHMCVR